MAGGTLLTDCEMAACAKEALQKFDMGVEGSVIEIEHRGRKTRWASKSRADLEKAVTYWSGLCTASGGTDTTIANRYRRGVVRCLGRK